jgi:hypothetical protein
MTPQEYLDKKFRLGNTVKVVFNDGTDRTIVLDRPDLYSHPGDTGYLTGLGTPDGEPSIVVYISLSQPTSPKAEVIPISQVRDVIQISP